MTVDLSDIMGKLITAGILGWVALVTKHVLYHPRKDKKAKDIIFTKIRELENGRQHRKEAVGIEDVVGIGDHGHCPTCSAPVKRLDQGKP